MHSARLRASPPKLIQFSRQLLQAAGMEEPIHEKYCPQRCDGLKVLLMGFVPQAFYCGLLCQADAQCPSGASCRKAAPGGLARKQFSNIISCDLPLEV